MEVTRLSAVVTCESLSREEVEGKVNTYKDLFNETQGGNSEKRKKKIMKYSSMVFIILSQHFMNLDGDLVFISHQDSKEKDLKLHLQDTKCIWQVI